MSHWSSLGEEADGVAKVAATVEEVVGLVRGDVALHGTDARWNRDLMAAKRQWSRLLLPPEREPLVRYSSSSPAQRLYLAPI